MWRTFVVAAALVAQTTSTSTSSSTSTTSTTVSPLEQACLTAECTPRPPDAFVAASSGEIKADTESSCWSPPVGVGLCVDTLFQPPAEALPVTQGETLTLRFTIRSIPRTLIVRQFERDNVGPPLPIPLGNPAQFRADLPVGIVVLMMTSVWLQGDASYLVKLDVRAPTRPAQPTRAPVSFTG